VLDTLIPRDAEVQSVEGQWFSMRIQPYRTTANVIEGAVLTFVDITKARMLQEQLRANEERLRVALSSFPIAMFNQDASLRYTWVHNPAQGFKARYVIGKTDADLLPEKEAVALTALKQQVLDSGQGVRQNVQTTIEGKTFVFDLTIEPLRDGAGAVVGITCACVDVTARQGGEPPATSDQESEEP
jgi:PAS domain S-box-containing protein